MDFPIDFSPSEVILKQIVKSHFDRPPNFVSFLVLQKYLCFDLQKCFLVSVTIWKAFIEHLKREHIYSLSFPGKILCFSINFPTADKQEVA